MERELEIGDYVKYSAMFCRNTGQYTGSTPFARGKIVDLVRNGKSEHAMVMAIVNWTNDYAGEVPVKVNVGNLVHRDDPETRSR